MNPPRWLYRVDTRMPEIVFEHGFSPWGTMRDFLYHISGAGTRAASESRPIAEMDGIVSASESTLAVLRFFASSLALPGIESPRIWLYHIRATENFYSAAMTAQDLLIRVNRNEVVYNMGTREEANELLDDVLFGVFSHQREWFSDGPIPRETIRAAQLVTSIPVSPDEASSSAYNPFQLPLVFLPTLGSEFRINEHYVGASTNANPNPWNPNPAIAPMHVTIPPITFLADVSGAAATPLYFSCDSAEPHSLRKEKNLSLDMVEKNEVSCFLPRNVYAFETKKQSKVHIPSPFEKTYVYLESSVTQKTFILATDNNSSIQPSKAILVDNETLAHKLIYDVHQRISFPLDINTGLTYSLTAIPTSDVSFYVVGTFPSSTNNIDQKWEFIPVANKKGYFKIKTQIITNNTFVLVKDKSIADNHIYLMNEDSIGQNYEILYLVIDTKKTSNQFLLPQKAESNLIDLQLCWEYENYFYHLVPETGWSTDGKPGKYSFFYDLNSYKILYIKTNEYKSIFALKNCRDDSQDWNWVRWVPMKETHDSDMSLKWAFVAINIPSVYNYNFRNICSLMNNDVCWFVYKGSRWGGCFTADKKSSQIRSRGLFIISDSCPV